MKRRQIVDAVARFLVRIRKSPKTSGAALAVLFGTCHQLWSKPALMVDPAFLGGLIVAASTIYGLFEANDTKLD